MFECPEVQVWLLLAAEVVFLSLLVCLFSLKTPEDVGDSSVSFPVPCPLNSLLLD